MADRNPLGQLRELFFSLTLAQRVAAGAVAAAIGLAIGVFAYSQREADYRPLYKSLTPEDAGKVVQKLKEKEIPFRLAEDGSAVHVPAKRLAELRLELAQLGLPKSGRIGFELFDQTKFGATDFAEHVNYRRALEGELERSMMAMAEVEQARVHLTFAKDSVFTENRLPAKASVMLKLRDTMPEQNIAAIRYLVASAVETLTPENVSVLDIQGRVLGKPKAKGAVDGAEPSEAVIEFRRAIERDLATKVNLTLEPLLGPDKFRASVVAECDFSTSEQSEEILDPTKSVATREQTSKESSIAAEAAGVPGTNANLPRATPRPNTKADVTRETSDVSYQTARTVRTTRQPQGNIRRLSVSVLVDHVTRWQGEGAGARKVSAPPDAEMLRKITEVVGAAAGVVPERGDRVVVESLPFETNQEPPAAVPGPSSNPWWSDVRPQHLVIVVLAAALALGWWRSRPSKTPDTAEPVAVAELPAPMAGELPAAVDLPAPSAALQIESSPETEAMSRAQTARQKELAASGAEMQRLLGEAVELSKTERELCAGVLRAWLNEKEPVAAGSGERS
jgi:flagellar M-ring protein FliF